MENTVYVKRRQDGDCRIYYKEHRKKYHSWSTIMYGRSKVQKYTSLCLLPVSASERVWDCSLWDVTAKFNKKHPDHLAIHSAVTHLFITQSIYAIHVSEISLTMYTIWKGYVRLGSHSAEHKIMLDKTAVLKLLATLYGFI